MARLKSPEKRQAILNATVSEIAQVGLSASTARIAKGAELAEGTIFTYFSSKDDLFNELYVALKTEVYGRIHADFPHHSGLRERVRHIWIEYLRWAMEKPAERKVSVLLNLSTEVSAATRERVGAERSAVTQALQELDPRGAFQGLPSGFAASAMTAMQEAVMEMASKHPHQADQFIERAFDAFWRMAE